MKLKWEIYNGIWKRTRKSDLSISRIWVSTGMDQEQILVENENELERIVDTSWKEQVKAAGMVRF